MLVAQTLTSWWGWVWGVGVRQTLMCQGPRASLIRPWWTRLKEFIELFENSNKRSFTRSLSQWDVSLLSPFDKNTNFHWYLISPLIQMEVLQYTIKFILICYELDKPNIRNCRNAKKWILSYKRKDRQLYTTTYCQLSSLTGCSGVGWTLVMKIDGRKVSKRKKWY